MTLSSILKSGTMVLIWKNNSEELRDITNIELMKRLYKVFKFNEPAPPTIYVYLQHHLESRPDSELGDGEKEFDPYKYQMSVNI
ncbi:MAG: hypothetical protein IPH77_14340 [Ignavibacteria bacterium]|nr:hypothetical protein [Ignavibacteria bacterium]